VTAVAQDRVEFVSKLRNPAEGPQDCAAQRQDLPESGERLPRPCCPSSVALANGTPNVVQDGEGDALTIAADCRQLGFVRQPCQMQGAAKVNTVALRSRTLTFPEPTSRSSGPESPIQAPRVVVRRAQEEWTCPYIPRGAKASKTVATLSCLMGWSASRPPTQGPGKVLYSRHGERMGSRRCS
jgi:hypothetical protein